MQLKEVGQLLAMISSFDNRKLDESTAMSWKLMLDREIPTATLDVCLEVVLDWFATANPYFEVRHLVDGSKRKLRLMPKQIADDVRSAIARGLLPWGADPRTPLTPEVAGRLADARADAQAAAPEVETIADRTTLALDVGKRVPRG